MYKLLITIFILGLLFVSFWFAPFKTGRVVAKVFIKVGKAIVEGIRIVLDEAPAIASDISSELDRASQAEKGKKKGDD